MSKVIGALAVIMAGTLITFVWALITHQITLVIP
jgi:hypothetical protein